MSDLNLRKRKSSINEENSVSEDDILTENGNGNSKIDERPEKRLKFTTNDVDVSCPANNVNKVEEMKVLNENEENINGINVSKDATEITDLQDSAPLQEAIENSNKYETHSVNDLVEENNDCLDNESNLITVSFSSKTLADTFKEKIINALMTIHDICVIDKVNKESQLIVIPKIQECNEEHLSSDDKLKSKKKKQEKKKDDLFTVDTKPSYKQENLKLRYSCKFSLDINNLEKSESIQTTVKEQVSSCFNCSENHNLRDCPHPKDFVKINKAKTKISKSVRYHLEEDQKYHELRPGKLSHKLKEALGLRNNELPLFIYRMRHMGYPPGWVEEAYESNSDLSLFDCEGKLMEGAKKEIKINPEKIIEFPGFNAPMDKYIKDEYKSYGTAKYSKHINKESIFEIIKKFKDNHESCDMDIDEEEETIEPPGCEEKIHRLSPTLNDLEEEKMKLLAQLNEGENSQSGNDSSNDKNDELIQLTDKPEAKDEKGTENEVITENTDIIKAAVKMSTFGTPILERKYPYKRLPHPDKFSVNISPVINFENLPNSTGKFEQMIGILQKVRAFKNSDGSKL